MSVSLPGRVALVCAAIAIGIVLANLGAPIGALLAPTPGAPASLEEGIGNLSSRMDDRIASINGRSLFFVPDAPPPPAPPARVVEDTGPLPDPPPPSRYAGPRLVAMINNIAWFSDGTQLGIDQADGDLRVKRLLPPWEAVVEWQGAEFTVSLFERDRIVLKDAPADATAQSESNDETVALDDEDSPLESPLNSEDQR